MSTNTHSCVGCKYAKTDGWEEPCSSCSYPRSNYTAELPEIRLRAMELYEAPFKYFRGYIWDANSEMVADDGDVDVAARIRGWGRIQKLPDAAALQDEVGHMLADALNDYYEKHKP